ncbi:MAG: hypothetical protein ACE14V_11670 [bacterium]
MNGFITTIDVWLQENTPEAKENVNSSSQRTKSLWEFQELLDRYSIYLPENIIRAGREFFVECLSLSNLPSKQKAEQCINLLFSFQNTIRDCVGADRISTELLKSFGTKQINRQETKKDK